MQDFQIVDNGLTKKGLQEVSSMLDATRYGFSKMIEVMKIELNQKIEHFESSQDKKWDDMDNFKSSINQSLSDIQKSITGLEFKHNWKTAMWVFIGAALPNAIGFIFFLLRK